MKGSLHLAPRTLDQPRLSQASTSELLVELDRRSASLLDQAPGTSYQLCPVCSTHETEIYGEFERSRSLFLCDSCGSRLRGNQYEQRLEAYCASCFRAKKASGGFSAALAKIRKGK